jgi:hypothetical protein
MQNLNSLLKHAFDGVFDKEFRFFMRKCLVRLRANHNAAQQYLAIWGPFLYMQLPVAVAAPSVIYRQLHQLLVLQQLERPLLDSGCCPSATYCCWTLAGAWRSLLV